MYMNCDLIIIIKSRNHNPHPHRIKHYYLFVFVYKFGFISRISSYIRTSVIRNLLQKLARTSLMFGIKVNDTQCISGFVFVISASKTEKRHIQTYSPVPWVGDSEGFECIQILFQITTHQGIIVEVELRFVYIVYMLHTTHVNRIQNRAASERSK